MKVFSARIAVRITLGPVTEILIVDDHEAVRDALVGMVEHAGYPAVAFSNPAGALARIAEHRPTLILLDMMMPEIDGADFLARLARLHGGERVPVIVVSAMGHLLQGMRRGETQAAGVVDVLAKPVSYTTLVEAIARIIGPPDEAARRDG
jgi:CheY-like chemotaxis protein